MATMDPDNSMKYRFLRRIVQTVSLFLLNPVFHYDMFKGVCLPVMNCWSCPAAAGACPIGAIGYYLAAGFIPWLVFGVMIAFGVLVGRMFCGWVCPFGFIQELIHKIPTKKFQPPKVLLLGKYVILIFFVFIAAAFLRDTETNTYFCSWCPVGMLEAALPMKAYEAAGGDIAIHPSERPESDLPLGGGIEETKKNKGMGLGWFLLSLPKYFKFWVLVITLVGALLMNRFFCRVMCPIGAMLGIFNKISFYTLKLGRGVCKGCGSCKGDCSMDPDLKPAEDSPECVRCFDCLPTPCEMKYEVTINDNWCKSCGFCAQFCPSGVFEQDKLKRVSIVHPEMCIGCGWCTRLCPDFGITVKQVGVKTREEREHLEIELDGKK